MSKLKLRREIKHCLFVLASVFFLAGIIPVTAYRVNAMDASHPDLTNNIEDGIYVIGVDIANSDTLDEEGNHVVNASTKGVKGTITSGSATLTYDSRSGTPVLTLNDFVVSGEGLRDDDHRYTMIFNDLSSPLIIVLHGNSSITQVISNPCNVAYGIASEKPLTIKGDGTLTITSGDVRSDDSYCVSDAICARRFLTISDRCTVIATGGSNSGFSSCRSYGVYNWVGVVNVRDHARLIAAGGSAASGTGLCKSFGVCCGGVSLESGAELISTGATVSGNNIDNCTAGISTEGTVLVNGKGTMLKAKGGSAIGGSGSCYGMQFLLSELRSFGSGTYVFASGDDKAIDGDFTNDVAGKSYENTEGTGFGDDIPVNTSGQSLDGKYKCAVFPGPFCTLILDCNGGTPVLEGVPALIGTEAEFSGEVFFYSGHMLTGWNTRPDGSGQSYPVNGKVTLTGDMTLYAQWREVSDDVADATVSGIFDRTYSGAAMTQDPQLVLEGVNLVKDKDYTLSFENNVNIGTAVIRINGIGKYHGTKYVTFRILSEQQAANMTYAIVTGLEDKTYTGKKITQNLTVNVGGIDLKNKKDYTLTYKNNKKMGTATVTIKGKGKYKGTQDVTFKIGKGDNPLKLTGKTVKIKVGSLTKKDKAVSLSRAIKTNKKGQGKVHYKKESGDDCLSISSKGKVTVKKGTAKGTYTLVVKASAKGNSNFNPGSANATVTVKVV